VHNKFPFVCTGKIETCWRMLKSSFNNIKWNSDPRKIDEILNTFCLRTIVKTYKVYQFTLKRLKDYFTYKVQKYLKHQPEGEGFLPFIDKIDVLNNIITERGYLWRNEAERDKYIKLITH
jgi:hypothetical protein